MRTGSHTAQEQQEKESFDKGIAFMESGEYDQAIEALTEAIRLCRGSARAYLARAHAYAEQGDHTLAIADCSSVLRLDPDNFRSYRLRAQMYEQSGNWSKAERDIAKARQLEMRRK